jgi:hypothetical protein
MTDSLPAPTGMHATIKIRWHDVFAAGRPRFDGRDDAVPRSPSRAYIPIADRTRFYMQVATRESLENILWQFGE